MSAEQPSQGVFVVGYVLEQRSTDLRYSKQPQKINSFCKENGYNLIFTEQEVGAPRNICRTGLWRVTRALVCYICDAGDMPISYDVEAWVQRAMQPCRCKEGTGVNGIVATNINAICTEPVIGSKFVLSLAIARKHMFVSEQGKCISCCNPAAQAFMNKRRGL